MTRPRPPAPGRLTTTATKPGAVRNWPLALIGAGIIAYAVRHVLPHPDAARTEAQHQALTVAARILTYAAPALLLSGLLLAALHAAWRRPNPHHGRRGTQTLRVLSAAAAALHTPPDLLGLHRPRWRRHQLTAGWLTYPAGTVVTDLAGPLAAALAPFTADRLTATWEPARDRFRLTAAQTRIEDTSRPIRSLADTLALIVGDGLQIDQHATAIDPVSGQVTRLVARYPHTTRDIGAGFRARVAAVLDAKAPSPTGYWQLDWAPEHNTVTITPAQPLPTAAAYPLEMPGRNEQLRVPIGVAEADHVVSWTPDTAPHFLLAGPTGTGKTIALNTLIIGGALRGWDWQLADPKELSFRGFAGWPGVRAIATDDAEMEQVIDDVYQLMRARYRAIKNFTVRKSDLTPIGLVVDEAGELVERLNAYHTSSEKHTALLEEAARDGRDPKDVKKPTGKNGELLKLWSLLRLGREARVYVVVATQRPDVTFIPGEARSNMVSRLALGTLDGAGLEMVFGTRAVQQRSTDRDPATGTHTRVPGRATFGLLGAGTTALQTYWMPDPAAARTGDLTPADTQLVQHVRDLVAQARAALGIDDTAPTQALPDGLDPDSIPDTASADEQLRDDLRHAEDDLPPTPDVIDTTGMPTLPARRLRPGTAAVLEVDGRPTLVDIEDITPDLDDPDVLEITYRISGTDPRAGQPGITTYADDEAIPTLDHHDPWSDDDWSDWPAA